jgi:hypothetical protein
MSIAPNANAITLRSIRELDLPALECVVDAENPGSQPPSAEFLDELSLTEQTAVILEKDSIL